MAKLLRSFVKGIMNKDLDERLLPSGEFRDAQNVSIGTSESSDVGAVENTKGNIDVSQLGPGGSGLLSANARCLGATTFDEEFKIYWFVRDGLTSYIFEYDEVNDITTTVIADDRAVGTNVLDFQVAPSTVDTYLITGVNYYDGFLYWTDNYNSPKQLNVGRSKTNTANYGNAWLTRPAVDGGALSLFDINVIVLPPQAGPYLTMSNNGTQENNLEERFVEFAYRWKYQDNRYSPLSPFSATSFEPGIFQYDYVSGINKAMANIFNEVEVKFNTGIPQVEEIQVLFRDTSSPNIYIIENINKAELGYASNAEELLTFDNSKIYTVLSQEQLGRLFDNVPLKAQAQEIVGRRLLYGNYLEFRDLVSMGEPMKLRYTVNYRSLDLTTNPDLQGERTFRSDRDYEIGIAYLDEFQRQTTVLTPATVTTGPLQSYSTVYIPPTQSASQNDIEIEIYNYAPDWATHYRLYIKQRKIDYYNIFPFIFYQDGAYRWFKIEKADVDKVVIGDYIIAKANELGPTYSNTQYKVLDMGVKALNFLGNNEPPGLYFKIGVDGGEFDEKNLTNVTTYSEGCLGKRQTWANQGPFPFPTFNWREIINQTSPSANFPSVQKWHWENVNYPVHYPVKPSNLNDVYVDNPPGSAHASGFSQDDRLTLTVRPGNTFDVYSFRTGTIGTGIAMVGTPQTIPGLSNGYRIAFPSPGMYEIGDRWVINIRSLRHWGSSGATQGPGGLSLGGATWEGVAGGVTTGISGTFSTSGQLIGTGEGGSAKGGWVVLPNDSFVTVGPSNNSHDEDATDKVIKAGAQITFNYIKMTNQTGPSYDTPYQGPYTSSRDYPNIEEWFWEDEIYKVFKQLDSTGTDIGYENVFFRRGFDWVLHSRFTSIETHCINSQSYPPVRMIIKGDGEWKRSMRSFVYASMTIIQPESPIFFETTPIDNDSDLYHETYISAPLTLLKAPTGQNLHQGNYASQAIGGSAIVRLNDYNAGFPSQITNNMLYNGYAFGNGLESNRIKDDFNAPTLEYSPRVSTIIDDYKQERRGDSLTYSATFGHLINGFNDFNLSTGNFKDLDISFGSIQKLFARDTNVLVLQQNKVSQVLYGKNMLTDATGDSQIASIPEVLGTQAAYIGEYGISDNPESFAEWGSNIYFTDERRGCVLSLEGVTLNEISSDGMRDYFKDFFNSTPRQVKLGAMDPYSQKYNLAGIDVGLPCSFKVQTRLEGGTYFENGDEYYVGSGASTQCFLIETDATWSVVAVGAPAWVLSITPTSGTGNGGVCVSLAASPGIDRNFTLRFTACGTTFDVEIYQRGIPTTIIVIPIVEINPEDSGSGGQLNPAYTYPAYPGAGGSVPLPGDIGPISPIGEWGGCEGWPPNDGAPNIGDTVTLFGPANPTDANTKGFEQGLGNTMKFLVSTTAYSPADLSTIDAAATLIAPIYNAGEFRWDGTFIYNNPANDQYLYLLWDYKDRIAAGSTGSSIGKLGTNHVELDFGTDVGTAEVTYDANNTPNRFVLKYNEVVVEDTGYVGLNTLANYNALIAAGVPDSEINLSFPYNGLVNNGVGTITFNKYSSAVTTGELDVYTKITPSDGWDAGVVAPTLTAFNINTTPRNDDSAVCADTAVTTYYHNGVGAVPIIGDTIYTTADGSQIFQGDSAYFATGVAGPANTWIVITSRGVVSEVGSCACTEVAVPVITGSTFTFLPGEIVNLDLDVTNNPTEWEVQGTCVNYTLFGGDSGGTFQGTNCLVVETKTVSVPKGEYVVTDFQLGTVSKIVGDATATFTAGQVSPRSMLPPGISFGTSGTLTGNANVPGLYMITVTATNCFGTSVPATITIEVLSPGYNRFYMDGTTDHDTSADACAAGPADPGTRFYHDGQWSHNGEYPILNDVVYLEQMNPSGDYAGAQVTQQQASVDAYDAYYHRFNGGNKWYTLADSTVVIQIAIDGTVINTFDCTSGTFKFTEAGPGGVAPNTIKTTEGGANKTLE
jgi:hypothetical protein